MPDGNKNRRLPVRAPLWREAETSSLVQALAVSTDSKAVARPVRHRQPDVASGRGTGTFFHSLKKADGLWLPRRGRLGDDTRTRRGNRTGLSRGKRGSIRSSDYPVPPAAGAEETSYCPAGSVSDRPCRCCGAGADDMSGLRPRSGIWESLENGCKRAVTIS